MRSNFSFAFAARDDVDASEEHVSALSMRLCRDYVSENAIPMRGEADVAADVRWVDHDGSMEWNEEAKIERQKVGGEARGGRVLNVLNVLNASIVTVEVLNMTASMLTCMSTWAT